MWRTTSSSGLKAPRLEEVRALLLLGSTPRDQISSSLGPSVTTGPMITAAYRQHEIRPFRPDSTRGRVIVAGKMIGESTMLPWSCSLICSSYVAHSCSSFHHDCAIFHHSCALMTLLSLSIFSSAVPLHPFVLMFQLHDCGTRPILSLLGFMTLSRCCLMIHASYHCSLV